MKARSLVKMLYTQTLAEESEKDKYRRPVADLELVFNLSGVSSLALRLRRSGNHRIYSINFFVEDHADQIEHLVVVDTHSASRLKHVSPLLDRLKRGRSPFDLAAHMNPYFAIGRITRLNVWDHHPNKDDDIALPSSSPGSSLSDSHEPLSLTDSTYLVEKVGACASLMARELHLRSETDEKLKLSPLEATWIGMGIYEDTGGFLYPNTTQLDLQMVLLLQFTCSPYLQVRQRTCERMAWT